MKTYTKGDVIVEEIKIGDIHYEYEYGLCVKSKVLTLPEKNEHGQWEWTSEHFTNGSIIIYLIDPKYAHYSANLYNNEVYEGCKYI